ncbi:multidrug efflux SMR transporter [Xanthobacteraceae bacterium Astr-EGSB]|nr:multidrug efflux SMR transporter [Xanthobacteraceae bacterium Astr-EGSB]
MTKSKTNPMSLPAAYAVLLLAIVAEVIATSALNASDGFTRLGPSLITVAGYGLAFFCLAHTVRYIPVGIAYAIWSGIGMVLIAAIGWIWFRQTLDTAAMVGIGLILAGVLVINTMSSSVGH